MSSNIKKRNKSLNKYIGSQKEKQKLIESTLKTNYNTNKEYDNFQSTISSIAKQLNNISLKSFSQTKIKTNIFKENQKNNNYKISSKQNPILKIINNNSFIINGINLNFINEKNEIKKENENLKENIKFLLGQIKKYQKSGITIEENIQNEENELNNELRNIINIREKEIDKLNKEIILYKKRIQFLESENEKMNQKYNELKIKYQSEFNNENYSKSFIEENQLYQYNSKKNNNTYYNNYENSKNNIENNNYNKKKFAFHKTHYTTDFSNNFLQKNNILKTNEDSNYFINKIKCPPKKLKNIKYLSLVTSANKKNQKQEIRIFPKSTKAYSKNSFLYKKTPIKSDISKSSMVKSITHNYFSLKNSKYNLHKVNKKYSNFLYHKKNSNLSQLYNSNNQNEIININIPTSTGSYTSYNDESIYFPNLDTSPNDLYFFSNIINNDNLYNFNINEMKFSLIKYNLSENSTFKYNYIQTKNHSYDIIYSISNGFLIITGANTNYLHFYSKEKNKIFDLTKLNTSHNKGSLIKINSEKIMCISGINTCEVEIYSIKDNIWLNIPRMNCPHYESGYLVYNNNLIFSFFGYDYEKNKYIEDVEYIEIKKYYIENAWNKINININNKLRSHAIFFRINKEKNDEKQIFIVGGYNNHGRNNGLIQILIEKKDNNFNVNFKKFEENKVKMKGSNLNVDKYNNNDNIFLFQNEFYQFFDEENNLFYNYNYDCNFNIHIIDNFTLKHTIYKNKLNN